MQDKRVLLVEDEPLVTEFLIDMFDMLRVEVIALSDPHLVAQSMSQHQFDLVLTDLMLPGMDGCVLCQQIKARAPKLPIVLMSGMVATGQVGICREADLILAKPLRFEQIKAMAKQFLFPDL